MEGCKSLRQEVPIEPLLTALLFPTSIPPVTGVPLVGKLMGKLHGLQQAPNKKQVMASHNISVAAPAALGVRMGSGSSAMRENALNYM